MPRSLHQVLSRLEHLEVLYKISNIINTTLEPGEILLLLLQEVVRITNATSGSIAMIDQRKGVLNIETAINIHPRLWKSCRLELGVGVTGNAAWTGKPIRVDDVASDPRYVRLKADIRSEMALPMTIKGKVIGVINVDSTRVKAFSFEDEDLCMAVAAQSARVIETARLYKAVKNHAEQMEGLFTVGSTLIMPGPLDQLLQRLVEEGKSLLAGKVCVLMEAMETNELRTWAIAGASEKWRAKPPVRIPNSLLGQVVKKKTPIRIADVHQNKKFQYAELAREEGLASLLAVPVVYQERVLAVLAVYSGEPRRFREPEVRLLQMLANQGAIAIENAHRMERLQTMEEQMRQAERLSVLGTLSAEIAHEIRNPITIINMLVHGICEDAGHTSRTREDLAIVTEKLDRINHIIEQTLSLSRTSESCKKPCNVNKLIEELLLFLNYKLQKARVDVATALHPKIPEIELDPGQIQQVLLNLMVNAMEAMKEGGSLAIKTRMARDRGVGPCVRITITDNGDGIQRESEKSLFEPFFTTRETGTGLGLFISNKLVKRHNGTIKVKSAAGKGSTFTITLPIEQEHPAE